MNETRENDSDKRNGNEEGKFVVIRNVEDAVDHNDLRINKRRNAVDFQQRFKRIRPRCCHSLQR